MQHRSFGSTPTTSRALAAGSTHLLICSIWRCKPLFEEHNGHVWLTAKACTIDLISLPVSTVAGLLFKQADLSGKQDSKTHQQ